MTDETGYEIIEGVVLSIVFCNSSNGWTVLKLDACGDEAVVVGYMPFVSEGESIRVTGKTVFHMEYGEQFAAEYCERCEPKSEESIVRFLSSGVIKGIGEATAKRIVERFGIKTLEVIETAPSALSDIKGISCEKAIKIGEAYAQKRGLQSLVMYLQRFGVSSQMTVRAYTCLGTNAVEQIRSNPYVLCERVDGFGFKSADKIALSSGVSINSSIRICSGIKHFLLFETQNGHTCYPRAALIEKTAEGLEVLEAEVENALINLITRRELIVELINYTEYIYLYGYHLAEQIVSGKLFSLNRENPVKNRELSGSGLFLSVTQQQAVDMVLKNNLCVITGGPGTGKTTVINEIIRILENNGLKVALTAPTGRAAKRITELCGQEAKTIHRLLEVAYNKDGSGDHFARNESNPIEADAVIVDEMSMVDILLMSSLLKALKLSSRLVLVGDCDQLPPVGAGNVLKDIIDSKTIPLIRLDEVFRQDKGSMIALNAQRILKGEFPQTDDEIGGFYIVKKYSAEDCIRVVLELVAKRIGQVFGYSTNEVCVLSPMKRTRLGVEELNRLLQHEINPAAESRKEKRLGNITLRCNDRVIQTKNNYDILWTKDDGETGFGVFNGDMGTVTDINESSEAVTVRFDDDRLVEYDEGHLSELELAYALTVHKSQGSEFKAVVLPLLYGPEVLLTKNLLYTAVTRARELLLIVGSEKMIDKAIKNISKNERFSGLLKKLKALSEEQG